MNATAWVVRYVRTAAPAPEALDTAAGQLARFHRARSAGRAPAALTALAAGSTDPLWTASESGAAAAVAGDPELTWTAVCAAAVALADGVRATTAVAVGHEVADRVAAALGPTHSAAGWDVRATAGQLGACAAAGRLCDLDEDTLRHAVGLCATQAAGLTAAAGTDAEALALGKAAANAVEAVLLAQCGFTSSAEPLEGRRGLFAVMSSGTGWR
ncbi:MmgE/PrpD family protein [Streptomyces odontomachi]|uniref:MmgE/PrpD family protein n=1 Tax=Streptomyces odontomachi TaxID=2944940 RepID=UPI00210DAAE0|nr:MmgE/PrpD family protein [Streptomyces sp. ODS25]